MMNEFALVPQTNTILLISYSLTPRVFVIAFKLELKISAMRGQFVPAVQVRLTEQTPT